MIIYFSSVIIWGIMLYAMAAVFGDMIVCNKWVQRENKVINVDRCFLCACIPIWRVILVGAMFYMAVKEKE